MKPEIKETIVQLHADGKSTDEIRAFLLENKVSVKAAELNKLLKALSPPEEMPEEAIIEQVVSLIESGKEESEIAEAIAEQFETHPKPQEEIKRVIEVAKMQISKAKYDQQKEQHASTVQAVKDAVGASVNEVVAKLEAADKAIDEAIKVKREHKQSFSRLINAKTTIKRLAKSLL